MLQASNVLVIGQPRPQFSDLGATFVPCAPAARQFLKDHRPAVLVFGDKIGEGDIADFDAFCRDVRESSPSTQWILVAPTPKQILHWANEGCLHDMIDHLDDPALPAKLQSALEQRAETEQRRKLTEMFEERAHTLRRLGAELESRVQRRFRTLNKSLMTLDATKSRLEAFLHALISIHRASSTAEMEQALNESLRETIHIEWTRVRFEHQSSLKHAVGQNVLSVELPFRKGELRGQVLFAKPKGQVFEPEETDFLHELTDVLALALSRLQKLGQATILKTEWQSTFDAIPHPLCLITADFEIIKLNRAFQQACGERSFRDLLGKNCFEVFFSDDGFLEVPEVPFSFRRARTGQKGTEHFEVIGEGLGDGQLVLLRNITEEVRFERRILEGSKLAELGTIGSSIAHELNNPLGGMLSFLQLILMDLKPTDTLFEEIKQMEVATLRCRDIVLNLLSFARKQDLGEFAEVDLRQVVTKAVKLTELQTKSRGIAIEVAAPGAAVVLASANALSQALCNVLQNAVDAIDEKHVADSRHLGQIRIEVASEAGRHLIRVTDNGAGIRPDVQSQIFNPLFTTRDPAKYGGMGLTSAFTIVTEHAGQLEILSQTGSGTTAIVAIPRPA